MALCCDFLRSAASASSWLVNPPRETLRVPSSGRATGRGLPAPGGHVGASFVDTEGAQEGAPGDQHAATDMDRRDGAVLDRVVDGAGIEGEERGDPARLRT